MAALGHALLEDLRRPFTAEALKWKVQANLSGGRGLLVAYIDARLVSERLNLVQGTDWHDNYRFFGDRIDSGLLWCDLTLGIVTRSDVGEGKGKAGVSDAFKRAGVKWGVGVPNYAVPQQILPSNPDGKLVNGKPPLRPVKKGEKTTLYITDACESWLADAYTDWLNAHGIKAFGEPLDHGDVAGSVGDPTDLASEPEQDNLELAAKRAEIEEAYKAATANGGDKRKLPPGRFKAELEGADSLEHLAALAAKVAELAA
jgi:hypothetical protein